MQASNTKKILEYQDVTLSYKDIHALKNISLTINQGESVVLCGPNGAGKTTLLKIASGLIKPTSGTVKLLGNTLDKKNRKRAFKKIGYVFQDSEDQLFCPTVGEDIAYGPSNMDLDESEVRDRVQHGLSVMNISHLANRPIHHLSGGEKKRVAIAGVLAMQPHIMIMDEPIIGLDPKTAHELIGIFVRLNKELGYTLIVASHEIDKLPDFAQRVIVLKDGTVFRDGKIEDIFTDMDSLKEANIEAPIITQYFHWKNQNSKKQTRLPLTLKEAFEIDKNQS